MSEDGLCTFGLNVATFVSFFLSALARFSLHLPRVLCKDYPRGHSKVTSRKFVVSLTPVTAPLPPLSCCFAFSLIIQVDQSR